MALVNKEALERANRYGNLLPKRPERLYASAYISWLKNGAVGYPPERGKVSKARAFEITEDLNRMGLWHV